MNIKLVKMPITGYALPANPHLFYTLVRLGQELHIMIRPKEALGQKQSYICITRRAWAVGGKLARVKVEHRTYREALRAFRHIVAKIMTTSGDYAYWLDHFLRLHKFLATADLTSPSGRTSATRAINIAVERFARARCPNRLIIREAISGQDLEKKSLTELLDLANPGAARAKIVFRVREPLRDERARIEKQINRLVFIEGVLGRIWTHELHVCSLALNRLIAFAGYLADFESDPESHQRIINLQALVLEATRQSFDLRVHYARKHLLALRKILLNSIGGSIPEEANTHLQAAMVNLEHYWVWLNLGDSEELTGRELESFSWVA